MGRLNVFYVVMGCWRPVKFSWANRPLLCSHLISQIFKARRLGNSNIEFSLDLGLSKEVCNITSEGVHLRNEFIEWSKLEGIMNRERDIYYVEKGKIMPLSIAGEHFYKLVLVKWGHPPTLEIDGIHMHRIKDITPDVDTEMKLSLLGSLRCSRILDTCMGLGYTAIEAIKRGACSVKTFEVDENVLKIASFNPWSSGLEDEKIEIYLGNVFQGVEEYSEYFDVIIHDPPRISLSGELYSLEFYFKLAEALKKNGRIVHYVGQPGIHSGKKIWRGVMERMRRAGFQVRYDPESRCVYGKKIE
ncbi:MAG: RsmD family RNA methyltransferase [Nitrososphaerota archaeon]